MFEALKRQSWMQHFFNQSVLQIFKQLFCPRFNSPKFAFYFIVKAENLITKAVCLNLFGYGFKLSVLQLGVSIFCAVAVSFSLELFRLIFLQNMILLLHNFWQ